MVGESVTEQETVENIASLLIAAKAVKEATYHLRYSSRWTIRLGDGTDESHHRMQAGLDAMWAAMDLENRPRKPATERERRAAQRKAERAAAVQNILRTRAEAERAMAQFEAQNGPVASKQEDVF